MSRALETLLVGAGVLSPVMEQLIPLPLYIPSFHAPEQAVLLQPLA